MESGLRMRRIQAVVRCWSLYRDLYEVDEVAFLRATSHGRALITKSTPLLKTLPLPAHVPLPLLPGRATLAPPALHVLACNCGSWATSHTYPSLS